MSDEIWKRHAADDDGFGAPLFGDDSVDDLSFGDETADPMPHWTAPPTGEVPATLAPAAADSTDDVDVWSSFSSNAPVWSGGDDGRSLDDIGDLAPVFDDDRGTSGRGLFDDDDDGGFDDSDRIDVSDEPVRPQRTARIQIGTDPTDGMTRPPAQSRRPGPDGPVRQRAPRPGQPGHVPGAVPGRVSPSRPGSRPGARPGGRAPGPHAGRPTGGTKGRDMPTAVAVGVGIAAVFIAAIKFSPWAVAVMVVLVLGLGAVEFFDRVAERGYFPAKAPGIVACVAAPVAVYHYGVGSLPLVMFLAFAAMAVSFVAAPSLESNPMPNMAITSLGVTWIGVLGSFATAILYYGRTAGVPHLGTDTLCLLAICVVANDVGALFVGSAVGRTPLRAWISPNKSVEGAVGGTVLTLGAMFLVNVSEISTTWNSLGDLLMLGLVVAIAAPIGDLTESMFKRNLDVKDFGSIVRGHGGVLDRFDGFLFVMPAVYYLLVYLQPWK
ncbi:MAG: phosphatidate cytidylyltransferase [Ilumatobacteraceae bacterium]